MTISLDKSLFAAMTLTLLATTVAAKADEFSAQTSNSTYNDTANQQAANTQDSDPTTRDSVRSHGHP